MIELVMGAAAAVLLVSYAWLGVRVDVLAARERLVEDREAGIWTAMKQLKESKRELLRERAAELDAYGDRLTDWEGRLGVYAVQLANMHGLLEKRVADDPRYKIFWEDIERGKQGAEEKKPGETA